MTTPTPARSSAYAKKLTDPRWLRKKADILIRDGNRCKFCKSEKNHLQVRFVVHRGIDPWDYPDEELQTVCIDCVDARSKVLDEMENSIRLLVKDMPIEDLQVVSGGLIAHLKAFPF